MNDSRHLGAVNSLLDSVKLKPEEVEEIYALLGEKEVEAFFKNLDDFGKSIPENADEVTLVKWLKSLSKTSPDAYNALSIIVRENKKLFDKIQEIFIEKII